MMVKNVSVTTVSLFKTLWLESSLMLNVFYIIVSQLYTYI